MRCTTTDLSERCHYLVLQLFSLAPNNPSYSLSSNLAFFCLPVSRSLPPRDVSWLHVLQINISLLAAGVSQNSLGGAAREEPVRSPALLVVGRQRSTAKGPASQPPHWKTSTGLNMLSEAELSCFRYLYAFQLRGLECTAVPQLLLPAMGSKGPSSCRRSSSATSPGARSGEDTLSRTFSPSGGVGRRMADNGQG